MGQEGQGLNGTMSSRYSDETYFDGPVVHFSQPRWVYV